MKKIKIRLMLLLFSMVLSIPVMAETSRIIEKRIHITPSQKIEMPGFGGAEVSVKSWPGDEVYIKMTVTMSCSNKKYEINYIKSVKMIVDEKPESVSFSYSAIGNESTWSHFLGIKFRMFYHESHAIKAEVYVPKSNPLTLKLSYGSVSLSDITGNVELYGQGNTISLADCPELKIIENDYGTTSIKNCSGNLKLKSLSGNVRVSEFKGHLNIKGDYSNINLSSVSAGQGQGIDISSCSGKLNLNDITGNIKINNPYSVMTFKNIRGDVILKGLSAPVSAENINGEWNSETEYAEVKLFRMKSENVVVKNLSGGVQLDFQENPSTLEIKNEYGNVSVTILPGFQGKTELVTEYGKIFTNTGLKIQENQDRVYASGQTGSGKGRINIETKSANITLNQK